MESRELINYKYQKGIYSVIHLVNLVKTNKITEQDFFDITRFNFSVMEKKGLNKDEDN